MLNKKFKKAVSSVTMFATVVCLSGVSMLAPLSAKAATVVDGDIIKSNATNSDGTPALSSLDVYIVKIVGTKKFKRLVLNPQVFASYGHLKWENIKTVSQAEEDSFATSSLVRVDGSDKVYALTPAGDTGAKSWVNVTATQFIDEAGSDANSIYTINSVDFGNYSAKGDITTVAELKAFYKDGSLPAEASDGALKVSLSSETPEAANIPAGVGVEFLKFNLTAKDDDVTVNSITLTAGGLGNATSIDSVALYDEDGNRLNTTLKDVNAEKEAVLNVSGFVVEAGTTETVTVKASVQTGVASLFNLGIASDEDISSNASSVAGDFPVRGNDLNSVVATGLATLTVDEDGTPSDVNLGDKDTVIAKFKITNDDKETSTVTKIALKRDSSVTSSAADDDFENLALYSGSTKIAEADAITNKYVTFNIEDGIEITKSQTKKFTVKADVIDGAGKKIKLSLDNGIDVNAEGANYPSKVTDSYDGSEVTINAGAVTLEKVNATSTKVRPDTDNVELGTFKVTANSGEEVKISSLALKIASSNDISNYNTANNPDLVATDDYSQIENVEVYDKTDGIVYDLTYNSANAGNSTTVKFYRNTGVDIYMESGETHELVVRADVKSTATNEDYTVSISDAASQMIIKETANDTTLSDITPNAVSLSKVTVQTSGVTLSVNPLSSPKTAVVGTSGVEAINFNIEAAEVSPIKVTELKFIDTVSPTTFNRTLVSGFALYEDGKTDPIKSVGTSSLAGGEVTFSDLDIDIAAGDSVKFYVTLDLVKDSTNTDTMKLRLSGYSIEENTDNSSDALYDTVADDGAGAGNPSDGVIDAAEAGATSLLSARTIAAAGIGSLYVSTDNTDAKTDADIYAVAGTLTPEIATLKLRANNEDVKVTKIVVTASAAIAGTVTKLSLFKAGETTPFATKSNIGTSTTFDNLDLVIGQSDTKVYLKADLGLIGKDRTAAVNKNVTFHFGAIEAEGADSGDALAVNTTASVDAGEIAYDTHGNGSFGDAGDTATTAESKAVGVLASRISSVELVSSNSGNSVATQISGTGTYNAAIVKVTSDASSNTVISDGTAIKTALTAMKLKLTKNAKTAISGITVEKIGGTQGAQNAAATVSSTITVLTDGATATGNEALIAFKLNGSESIPAATCATGDVTADCATKIAAVINGFADYDASAVGGVITVTSRLPFEITDAVAVAGCSVTVTTNNSNYTTFSGLSGVDFQIEPSTTVYYLVKVAVAGLETNLGNDWIQVDLDALNGADGHSDSAGANFTWTDESSANAKFPLRLDGISNINGTKINEQS